jgi:hypothetical protein
MSLFYRIAVLLLLVAFPPLLRADGIIYSTLGPGGSFLTFDPSCAGTCAWEIGSDPNSGNIQEQIAAPFTPTSSSQLGSIELPASHVWGTNQLTVYLASGSAQPGSPIETLSVSGISDNPTLLTFNSVSNPVLLAGITYWVVVTETDLSSGEMFWYWNPLGLTDGFVYKREPCTGTPPCSGTQGQWVLDTGHGDPVPAFQVNAVPEPTTLLQLGTGLGVLLLMLARSKRLSVISF